MAQTLNMSKVCACVQSHGSCGLDEEAFQLGQEF